MAIMVYSLTYSRPPFVNSTHPSSLNENERTGLAGGSVTSLQRNGVSLGIPDALSFDRVVGGGTCPVRSAYQSTD